MGKQDMDDKRDKKYTYKQAIVPFTQFLTFGFEGDAKEGNPPIHRQLVGCLLNSVNIRFGVGQEDVMCNASVICGIDGASADVDMSADNVIDEPEGPPHTFDHATLMINGADAGEVQNVELTIDPKHQLVYKTGEKQAVNGHKTLTEYRGKATFTFRDGVGLGYVKQRSPETELKIVMKDSHNNSPITFTLTDIQFLEHSNPTIEPNQLVTQDLSYQARTLEVSYA